MRRLDVVRLLIASSVGAWLTSGCGVQIHPIEELASPNEGGGGSMGTSGAAGRASPSGSAGAGGHAGVGGAGERTPPRDSGVPSATGGAPGTAGKGDNPVSSGGVGGASPVGGAGGNAPPSSGNGVTLGGTFVPQEKAIAIIHFGHSNMAGRGRGPDSVRPYFFTEVDARAWMYHPSGPKKGFLPALEPFTAGDTLSLAANPPTGGPGLPLVKEAAKRAPGFHFISLGFGQNALYCRNYLPGGSFYEAVISGPRMLKGQVTFGAIVIMLGITERHGTANDIQNYPNCINTIVSAIRKELNTPELPLLLTDYEMTANDSKGEDLRPTGDFGRVMIPRIHAVLTTVSNSALVGTEDLALTDDHHFQLDAHLTWAQRALDQMKMHGWFPWAQR